jgi:hypothetical protein
MAGSEATLYAIPGSHACMAAELMLRHKRIPFRRKDLFSGMHPVEVRLRGFSAEGGGCSASQCGGRPLAKRGRFPPMPPAPASPRPVVG